MEHAFTEDKLFNFRPVFFTGAFLSLGIGLYYLNIVYGVSVWWSLLLFLTVAPLCFCRSSRRAKRVLLASLLLTVSFFVGFFSFAITVRSFAQTSVYTGECNVQGRVVEIFENDECKRVVLDKLVINGERQKGKLVAYLPSSSSQDFTLAYTLSLHAEIDTVARTALKDLVGYMKDGIRYETYADEYRVGDRPFHALLWLRARIQSVVYQGMDKESASVTMALLVGDTSGIGRGLLQNIRYGGIAHIFAVSGLHVGALYGFCLAVFDKTKLKRTPKLARFFIVVTLLLFYGGVCGYSASILRAIVMCLSFYLCRLWLYGSDSIERIGIAGVLVLLLSPCSLFDIGFQLSFTACLGIVLFSRPITRFCYAVGDRLVKPADDADDHPPSIPRRVFRFFVSLFAVSASAQFATTPLLLATFGYVSGWSLIFNLLFVPIVTALFSVLLCMTVIACLLPLSVSAYILYAPSVVWSGILLLFHGVDLSRFAITCHVPFLSTYIYGFACTFLTDKWNISKTLRILLFGILFLCFVFSCFFL